MPLDEQFLMNKKLARQLYEDELAKNVVKNRQIFAEEDVKKRERIDKEHEKKMAVIAKQQKALKEEWRNR